MKYPENVYTSPKKVDIYPEKVDTQLSQLSHGNIGNIGNIAIIATFASAIFYVPTLFSYASAVFL